MSIAPLSALPVVYAAKLPGPLRHVGGHVWVALLLIMFVTQTPARAGSFEEGVAAYLREDFASALSYWLPLAQQGHRTAQFNIGVMYEKGQGVSKDLAQTARWYLAAAEQSEPQAQYELAVLYEHGSGVSQDVERARKWYTELLHNTLDDDDTRALKQKARARLDALPPPTVSQTAIEFKGGRFVFINSSTGNCVIALQGTITRDIRSRFQEVVETARKASCGDPWLLLESPGGLLYDAIDIGREIRDAHFRTIARAGCASACALIFMAGVQRTLVGPNAKIGLHQGAWVQGGTRTCDSTSYTYTSRDLARFVKAMVPDHAEAITTLIRETSCNSIRWLRGQRAIELGIATTLEPPLPLQGVARRAGVPIYRVDPPYPRAAVVAGITRGHVTARLAIDSIGIVSQVAIINAVPADVFDDAVIDALAHWRFAAEGAPYTAKIEVEFSLNSSSFDSAKNRSPSQDP